MENGTITFDTADASLEQEQTSQDQLPSAPTCVRAADRTVRHTWDIDFIHFVPYTVHMSDLRFEWDGAKNKENIRKHGIPFEEAQTVFLDEHAIRFFDPDHSQEEDRFIMLGMSCKLRILVVCHCYRVNDTVIRIISARKALKRETANYGS